MKYTITYPEYIYWKKDLNDINDISQFFSPKTFKKIVSAKNKVFEQGYIFDVVDVNKTNLLAFENIYKLHINQKKNPRVFEVTDIIEGLMSKNITIKMIQVTKGEEFIGGLIFQERQNYLSTCFKYFPFEIEIKLPISITYIAEYYLFKYSLEKNCSYLKHGKDRNQYGYNSDIGLARMKLQLNLQPHVFENTTSQLFNSFDWDGKQDVLLFHGSTKDEKITNATLFLADITSQDKYASILSNSFIHTTTITI
jgi:hypothetical protein